MPSFLWSLPIGIKVTLTLIGLLLYLAYRYLTSTFGYWKAQGVKFIKPLPVVGSAAPIFLMKEHLLHYHQRVYKENEGESFIGYYQGRIPTLMVFDPELIKKVFVKDFAHFVDHGFQMSEEADPLNALNLFNIEGQRWRDLRSKLVPTFTSGKIKAMFPLIQECTERFDEHLGTLAKSGEMFDAKDLLGCLFTDVIGSCIFGINCNTIKEPTNEFRVMGKRLIEVTPWQAIKGMIVFFFTDIAMKLKIGVTDSDVTEFFKKLTLDMVAHRKKKNIVRRDFMQLLMELKDHGSVSIDDDDEDKHHKQEIKSSEISNSTFKFDDIDLVAQATVFFLAGFETSSTVVSFTLLELAANPDVQRKAQLEIDEQLSQSDGKVTYESLKEMKYLDWVLQESMRKYPPVAVHFRACTKTYKIPDTNITLEKGCMVSIPNHALQNDPKFFPNPDRFEPERFSDDDALHKYQYIYSPFGEGPRQCIGNRFALIQSKMALLIFLQKYTISLTEKTVYPVEFDIKQFILTAKDGIWLKMESRVQE